MKEPCIDCPEKRVDEYGYLCDLACGKRTKWLNHQAGIKEVVEWLRSKERGRGERGEYLWGYIEAPEWQAKLKEWGL